MTTHDRRLGQAHAAWDGQHLLLDTGRVSRRWRLSAHGLATVSLRHRDGGELIAAPPACDWELPGGLPLADARLLAVDLTEDDDEGFALPHLRAELRFAYPAAGVELRFTAWALPDAPGVRTVLALRSVAGFRVPEATAPALAERLGIVAPSLRAVGYFNDTQNRNTPETPIIRDEPLPAPATCDWASIAAVPGCALVKESHRCANQPGHDGGAFVLDAAGLASSGWGLLPGEITPEFRSAWAHWSLAFPDDGPEALPAALRRFIALRYPHDPVRDAYAMCNTWGSTACGRDARDAAREDNVLRELEIAAAIGLDAVQIDDGWQVDLAATHWRPEARRGWRPHPAVYPQGWARVRERAVALGVELGLWASGQDIGGDELLANWRELGFTRGKLDFMTFAGYADLADFRAKVRGFVRATGHRVRINFDVTERSPRVGYLWLRECGSLYLANRKPHAPANVIYRPWLVLRDAWQLARWQRLQDIQLTVQNPLRTDRAVSDAWRHPTAYCLAICLFGTPLLLQQLQFLDAAQRVALRDLLAVYRRHRSAIHAGDIAPIGQQPSNAAHTGFHCRCPDGSGYVLVLRELENGEPLVDLPLPGIAGPLIDCEHGTEHPLTDGRLRLAIPEAPGYRLLRHAA